MTVGDAIDKIMSLPNTLDVHLKAGDGYMYAVIIYQVAPFKFHQKTVYFPNDNNNELTTYAYWDAVNTIRRSQCAA